MATAPTSTVNESFEMSSPRFSSPSGSCLLAMSNLHHLCFIHPAMCLISPTFLPLSRFRCFPFPLLVSGSPDSHVSDPAYGRGAIATAAAANSQTLALSACVYPRLRKSTQCSCRCLQSTQALCSDSRWTERQRGCLSGFIQHMRRYLNKVFWNVSFLHPFASLLGD